MYIQMAFLIVLAVLPIQSPRDAKSQSPHGIKADSNANKPPTLQSVAPVSQKATTENKNQGGKITPADKEQAVQVTSIPKISSESKKDLYDKALVVATWLLVLVGGFQIFYLWATVSATRKTAEAAETNASAVMDSDCALCLIVWQNFIHLNPEAPNGVLSHAFNWTFTNVGKSPAFVQKVASRFIVIKSLSDLPPEPQYPEGTELAYESEPLLAGATFEREISSPMESTLSFDGLEAEHRGKKCLLYAFGFVKYLDIYGREQETRFGLVYDSAPVPTMAVDKFRLAGPKPYNRYKDIKRRQKPN